MLARKDPETSTNASPFQFGDLVQPQQVKSQQSNTQPPPVPENNRQRTFRRAGNVCEIVAGASLNSAVIFTFHLLQVHPVGLLLALGVAHLYFTATAVGEKGRQVTNIMTGCSASLALLCSLSEPVSEWWEASTSKSVAQSEIQQMYAPPTNKSNWTTGVGIAVVIGVLVVYITSVSRTRR